jgi:hypothetical protein
MQYRFLLLGLVVIHVAATGQDSRISIGPWHLGNVSGELGIEGMHQVRYNTFNDYRDEQKSTYLIGGMRLNTSSYFWRPGIIDISLNGEFNPESRDEQYLVIPDRSEVRTLKKLEGRMSLLNGRDINMSAWMNFHQGYFNRENITNIRSGNKQWGSLLNFNNKILPFSVRYAGIHWDQTETETNRLFSMDQNSIQASSVKSFYEIDKHDLTYSYDDYTYTYADQNTISNKVNRLAMNNHFFFDREKKYGFRSHIQFYNQQGQNSFSKLDANEQLLFHLAHNLDLGSGWNYYRMNETNQLMRISRGNLSARHQLFRSLTSQVFTEISATRHTHFTESEIKSGADLKYTKKIPFGIFNLGYSYYRLTNNTESEPGPVNILNEPHTFSDPGNVLLEKPYVDPQSVIIYDATGSMILEEGADYYIIIINEFLEIVRIPGGMIPESGSILVSYSAIQPGTSRYTANNHRYQAGISLFNRFLELYYRGGLQDFRNVESAEFLTLNQYDQHVVGGKIRYRFMNGGVEYDMYNSSLVPYKRVNYFLNLHFRINSKWLVSGNGSLRDYMLIDTDVNHQYANVSGRISYQISSRIKANVQIGYLSQKGPGIDLELLNGRIEIMTHFRKLYFKTGLIHYNRTYTNSNFTYSRAFAQLSRKF